MNKIDPKKEIKLKKDIEALEIPLGNSIKLKKGLAVRITQALGGAYTVFTKTGHLVRVAGKDAPALGLKVVNLKKQKSSRTKLTSAQIKAKIKEQLKTCYDPEIPVNIVDLGLVYEYRAAKIAAGQYRADIKMTLTMPGCGMGDVLAKEVEDKCLAIAGVNDVKVILVMEPAWDQSRLSKAARLELGL